MGHGIGSEADDRTGVLLDGGEAWRDTHRDGDLEDGGGQPLVIWSSDRDAQTVLVLERQTSLGRPSHQDLQPLSVSVRGSFPNCGAGGGRPPRAVAGERLLDYDEMDLARGLDQMGEAIRRVQADLTAPIQARVALRIAEGRPRHAHPAFGDMSPSRTELAVDVAIDDELVGTVWLPRVAGEEDATYILALGIQDFVEDLVDPQWPPCPVHSHTLQADIGENGARWRCSSGEESVSIGSLNEPVGVADV
jgi:hypothetical protein